MNPSETSTPNPAPIANTVPLDPSALFRAARILIPVLLATVLTDFLFWGGSFGISVGIFFLGLEALMLSRHRGRIRLRTVVFALLLGATCVQSAIALSLSNVLAAVTLTLALAGEVFQPQLATLWARISE